MTSVPTPNALIRQYGVCTPEVLAGILGYTVRRMATAPVLTGTVVLSEFQPERVILLYLDALRRHAGRHGRPLVEVQQWHIAHELYHGLAEDAGVSPWRLRESQADSWADHLLQLTGEKHA